VSAGGLLLVIGSVWAVVPFIVSAVSQAVYLLVLAPHRYDHVDPPSPEGRRQTINAFGIYIAMTVVVCRSAWIGALLPISMTSFAALAGITVLWGVGVAYAVRQLVAMARMPAPEAE
jgi:hypothetical protein